MIIIYLLAIFGLAFLIKESSGPWHIMSTIRNKLMMNKYIGVFFFQLFECYFCVGFHAGWIINLLVTKSFVWNLLICWGLAGGAISLIIHTVLSRLER